jgi:hypothetical protein
VDNPRRQLADGPEPEGLEVAQRFGRLGHGPVRGRAVASRQVGAHDGRAARVHAGTEALVDEVEGRLHGRAARGDPAEDLAHRLDGLDVRLHRDLEPVVDALS